MKGQHGIVVVGVLLSGFMPLPAASQDSRPPSVFDRPELLREQQQDALRLKKDQEASRRELGTLPPGQERQLEERMRLQQLQQRQLRDRQRMEQQALQHRLRTAPRTAPQARQRAQAQRFEREGAEQRLQQKMRRGTWSHGRSSGAARSSSSGALRPSPSANPRSRLRFR